MPSRMFCLALLIVAVPAAADVESIDLANPILERNVSAGVPVEVRLINVLPQFGYDVRIETQVIPIPALTWPLAATRGAGSFCENIDTLFVQQLGTVTEETAVPPLIRQFRDQALAQNCTDVQKALLEQAIGGNTTRGLGTYSLSPGQKLVVTVKRADKDQAQVFELSAGARGEWRTLYGFMFIPSEDDEYFSKQDQMNAGSFIVTRQTDRNEFDFAPAVLFTWLPAGQQNRNWSHGVGAGLGFDLDDPVVFAGYVGTFNENVALTAGVVMHKQQRLSGRFEENQSIGENLDADQLTEQTYNANWYVGVALRFGSNPFSTAK